LTPFTTNPYNTAVTAYSNTNNTTPAVNAYETSENYVFEIAAPGYTKESFELTYTYPTFTLRASQPTERTNSSRNERSSYSYREFNYGSFTREFNVPNNADATNTSARYEDGILTVSVAKNNTTNNRSIKIS
jgi:HSP20 family protein